MALTRRRGKHSQDGVLLSREKGWAIDTGNYLVTLKATALSEREAVTAQMSPCLPKPFETFSVQQCSPNRHRGFVDSPGLLSLSAAEKKRGYGLEVVLWGVLRQQDGRDQRNARCHMELLHNKRLPTAAYKWSSFLCLGSGESLI